MMEENNMNESKQIRERFLADTRQHFFAAESANGETQSASRQNNNPRHCSMEERHCGKQGV